MPYRTPTSLSLTTAAAVRLHLALTQTELGRWLDLSQKQVEAVEAGRREFSAPARYRLWRLASLLPPAGPALPAPETLPPPSRRAGQAAKEKREAVLLRWRVRRCRHLASQLAFQLETLALQDEALRRRQGVAALRLVLATPPDLSYPDYDPATEEAWLARIEADTAALPPRPGPLARAHLRLRRQLLLDEAEAILRLLPPVPEE